MVRFVSSSTFCGPGPASTALLRTYSDSALDRIEPTTQQPSSSAVAEYDGGVGSLLSLGERAGSPNFCEAQDELVAGGAVLSSKLLVLVGPVVPLFVVVDHARTDGDYPFR
jgi:hypothetical protein